MTNYTHPGQHVTSTIDGQQYVSRDWQGNALFTCCRGRAACGRHTNYVPKVNAAARIAAGRAVWQVESVDERERTADLWTTRDNGETDRRVIGFENLTIVSPSEYARDMGAQIVDVEPGAFPSTAASSSTRSTARPRSCPSCHSKGKPRRMPGIEDPIERECINSWHRQQEAKD